MSESFTKRLRSGRFAVTLEITPPRKPLPDVLHRRARMLGDAAHAVNVIQRPGRMSSLAASEDLIAAGLEPVWHVASRGRGRADLIAEIAMAARAGVRAGLCVRGDHEDRDRRDTPKLRELVALMCEGLQGALVGATANQYGPRERVLANLFPKLDSGAEFVQTQPLFDWPSFRTLSDAIKQRAPQAKLVPMLMPLLSSDAATAVSTRLGIPLPSALHDRLAADRERGWTWFEESLAQIFESPLADGVAIMTREMDPPAAVSGRIAQLLTRLEC